MWIVCILCTRGSFLCGGRGHNGQGTTEGNGGKCEQCIIRYHCENVIIPINLCEIIKINRNLFSFSTLSISSKLWFLQQNIIVLRLFSYVLKLSYLLMLLNTLSGSNLSKLLLSN